MSNLPKFEIFQRDDGDYGWRFRAGNGEISAAAGEGFTRREDVSRAIHDFMDDVDPDGAGTARTHAPIIDVDLGK